MRETLEALEAGEVTVAEAEAQLAGYVTTDEGRYDAAREQRHGVPEAILAEGKRPDEVVSLARTALETTERAIVTRVKEETLEALKDDFPESARFDHDNRARTVVVKSTEFTAPEVKAVVGIATAGTSDANIGGEAATIAREMGAAVEFIEDIGVANLDRLLDRVEDLQETDVLVVAAGREGALPTVIAGLINSPVIGLPVSTGYGAGGDGRSALHSMLQSCTVLSIVNIDAGFVAGAQAGLIARAISRARQE
ncbi:MAG: nickel pincer cofactor biosynthesis protein LarB [Halobacteriales archaeon]